MLRSLILDNFQSFDHIELDLSGKSGSVKNHAFIYGENGSGKSNLINSMFLLMVSSGLINRVAMCSPDKADEIRGETQCKLAKGLRMIGSEGNMSLDYSFEFGENKARYVLSFDEEGIIVFESLEMRVQSRKGTLFRLEKGKEAHFSRNLLNNRSFKERIKSSISQYWGKRSFIRIVDEEIKKSNENFIRDNVNTNLIIFLDGISHIFVMSKNFNICTDFIKLPNGEIKLDNEHHLDKIGEQLDMFFTRLYSDVRGVYFKKTPISNGISYELYFHKNISNKVRDIPAVNESTGTLQMINVLGMLLSSVAGGTVFVDEMDTGVHDLLITGVVEQTLPEIKGQLVATTHNTCLMESLSPENVYVIGIDPMGFKRIRCVSSIERIRNGNNMRHKYFEGNFLGIPYIADLGMTDIMRAGE